MSANTAVQLFLDQVAQQYDDLSKQLKRIAVYIEGHKNEIVFNRVQDIADACEVQPSAIVRFAQRFGFKGYSDLQSIFRESMFAADASSHRYRQRIHEEIERGSPESSAVLAQRFIEASRRGLDALSDVFDPVAFEAAVDKLATTEHDLYVVGMGRSLSVASYLVYAFQNLNKRVHFVSGLGGDPRQYMRTIGPNDTLLAISFSPYASETQLCLQQARERGATVLLITDSVLAPICAFADIQLLVREQTAIAFKTLTSTICLAQALFIASAHRLERQAKPEPQ